MMILNAIDVAVELVKAKIQGPEFIHSEEPPNGIT